MYSHTTYTADPTLFTTTPLDAQHTRVTSLRSGQSCTLNHDGMLFLEFFSTPQNLTAAAQHFEISPQHAEIAAQPLLDNGILINCTNPHPIVRPPCIATPSHLSLQSPHHNTTLTILGIPYDGACTGTPGAQLAPDRLRRILRQSSTELPDLADAGNVLVLPGEDSARVHQRTHATAQALHDHTILAIGGDHSVSYPLIAAHSTPLTVVKIDAHYDCFPALPNEPVHHANMMHAIRDLPHVEQVIHLGIREEQHPAMDIADDLVFAQYSIFNAPTRRRLQNTLQSAQQLYISVDLDVLDPTLAPGTGFHIDHGWSVEQLVDALRLLHQSPVVGGDIVEFNPLLDRQGQTNSVVTQLFHTWTQLFGAHHAHLQHS